MTAIPAAHLIALGFEKGDPPVQSATGLPVGFGQREVLQRSPRMQLLVEDGYSAVPALTNDMGRLESFAAVIAWQVSR